MFLHTNNEILERESKKKQTQFHLKIVLRKNKIPRNKLKQGGKKPIFCKLKH